MKKAKDVEINKPDLAKVKLAPLAQKKCLKNIFLAAGLSAIIHVGLFIGVYCQASNNTGSQSSGQNGIKLEVDLSALNPANLANRNAHFAAAAAAAAAAAGAAGASANTGPAALLYQRGDAARGLQPCAVCHGAAGEGVGAGNPALGGQPAGYLSEQLIAWQKSERRNDPGNVMLEISRKLTPGEVAGLGAYASGLPGGLPRPGSPAASRSAHRDDPRNDASAPRPRGAE